MKRIWIVMLLFPLLLFGVDSDFDGVEDDVDQCLGTSMLDVVGSDGCSKKQKEKMQAVLYQGLSFINVDDNSDLQNYSLALMLSKESWLFYVGSGYFQYNTRRTNIDDFSDTTLLVQKTFVLAPNHSLKSSLSMVLPTFSTEGNRVDYGASGSYLFRHEKWDIEMGYQYDKINDDNAKDISTAFIYLGYNWDDFYGMIGYSQDNEQRKNSNLSLQYTYSENFSFTYTFSKANNNFYDSMHTLGVGYRF
jgi:hypothetical protein